MLAARGQVSGLLYSRSGLPGISGDVQVLLQNGRAAMFDSGTAPLMVTALLGADCYPHAATNVEVAETHISWVSGSIQSEMPISDFASSAVSGMTWVMCIPLWIGCRWQGV